MIDWYFDDLWDDVDGFFSICSVRSIWLKKKARDVTTSRRAQTQLRTPYYVVGVRTNSRFGSSSNTVFSHVFLRALLIRKYEKRQENEASQEKRKRAVIVKPVYDKEDWRVVRAGERGDIILNQTSIRCISRVYVESISLIRASS